MAPGFRPICKLKGLAALGDLTPGDFAQVRNRADISGLDDKPASIAALLFEISRQCPGVSGRIGF